MAGRGITNLLALAVLGLLTERPMHPYEMSRTLRERAKEHSIKLNYGSLYSVVDQLLRYGAIEAQGTTRAGRRPERTVYRITAAGRAKFEGWLSDILRKPEKEYPRFEAGLSLMPGLPPERVLELLRERAERLREHVTAARAQFAELGGVLPRLLWIEHDYEVALLETELTFVERLIEDIERGTLEGIELWRDRACLVGFDADHRQAHQSADPPLEPSAQTRATRRRARHGSEPDDPHQPDPPAQPRANTEQARRRTRKDR